MTGMASCSGPVRGKKEARSGFRAPGCGVKAGMGQRIVEGFAIRWCRENSILRIFTYTIPVRDDLSSVDE